MLALELTECRFDCRRVFVKHSSTPRERRAIIRGGMANSRAAATSYERVRSTATLAVAPRGRGADRRARLGAPEAEREETRRVAGTSLAAVHRNKQEGANDENRHRRYGQHRRKPHAQAHALGTS